MPSTTLLKPSSNMAVALLPLPARIELEMLGLHGLDAAQHLNQVALGARWLRPVCGSGSVDRRHENTNSRYTGRVLRATAVSNG